MFQEQNQTDNPLSTLDDVGGTDDGTFKPMCMDLDRDLDFDCVIWWSEDNSFRYFENTGSITSPEFTEQEGLTNPFDGIVEIGWRRAACGDIDGGST